MTVFVLFGTFVVFLLVGVPIAVSLGLATLISVLVGKVFPVTFMSQAVFTSLDSFPIMAIPFFILAGDLMGSGGISKRLLIVAESILGGATGGLALVSVVTCMFFAAISGSGPATVAAVGGIMIPEMVKRGYAKNFAAAINAASGAIGVIIPPSIPMVVYAISSETSIGGLFLAGVIPGILIGLFLMLISYLISKKNGWKSEKDKGSLKEIVQAVWDAKWALMVPMIILGGIYGGIMTPTEAAAVACAYGFIVGKFVYKELTWDITVRTVINSGLTTGIILILIGMATVFGRLLAAEQIPNMIASWLLALSNNWILILLLINAFLLFVGCIMETNAAIIILTPLLLPVVTNLGIDPVHFGIVMVVNLAIGFVTPPVGVNLFVASSVSKIPIEGVAKAAIPIVGIMLAALLLITYLPQLSLTLPKLFYN